MLRTSSEQRPQLVIVGPLPPPTHGVTVSTSLLLASAAVRGGFEVQHLDTSDHRSHETIGRWDARNMALGLTHTLRAVRMLARRRGGVVYLPLSQNSGGFFRDSLLVWVSSAAGWRVAAHLRGSEFQSHFYARRGPMLRFWIRATLRRVDSIGVLGESLRDVFTGLVPPERLAVVPNGTPDVKLPRQFRDHRRVLFLSNLRRRKGVIEAIEAALAVVRDNPEATFTFVGNTDDPSLVNELRTRAKPAGGRIEILPAVEGDEKARLLAGAGILLFPPRLPEGHPRVVLEAMAAGMAIVTTAQGAIPETVRDGIDGFVLPSAEPSGIASCLSRLLADPDLQMRMGASARKRYEDEYTLDAADRRFVEWLTELNERSDGKP